MKRIHQLFAILLMALLIHPAPLVASDAEVLEVGCACCADIPCEFCDCVLENDHEPPVPFAAELNAPLIFSLVSLAEESVLPVPATHRGFRPVWSGESFAPPKGRYCERSCVLKL